jgi:hypothetical protein
MPRLSPKSPSRYVRPTVGKKTDWLTTSTTSRPQIPRNPLSVEPGLFQPSPPTATRSRPAPRRRDNSRRVACALTKPESCHRLAGVATRVLLPIGRKPCRSRLSTTPSATEEEADNHWSAVGSRPPVDRVRWAVRLLLEAPQAVAPAPWLCFRGLIGDSRASAGVARGRPCPRSPPRSSASDPRRSSWTSSRSRG